MDGEHKSYTLDEICHRAFEVIVAALDIAKIEGPALGSASTKKFNVTPPGSSGIFLWSFEIEGAGVPLQQWAIHVFPNGDLRPYDEEDIAAGFPNLFSDSVSSSLAGIILKKHKKRLPQDD